ncbi:MAG: transcriptional regulator, partial [Candidatus Lindowbacteria bacterium]|nr:transcriptional regulator [Candidatus Lindowbacteria bacterium]
GLPEDLTLDMLRVPHPSVPRNRLICEPLFLAHYIERAGTGTLDMIRLCKEAGLPEPEFRSEGERFVTVIWRDWLTEDVMAGLGLNERQIKAICLVKSKGRITSGEYQEQTRAEPRTATRDLACLLEKGIFIRHGEKRGAYYTLRGK